MAKHSFTWRWDHPTRSRGIIFSSAPCLRNTVPAVCCGLIPTPEFVMTALVAGLTLNYSATNFITAVNGAPSGTDSLLYPKQDESIQIFNLRSKWQVFITGISDLKCDFLLHFGSLLSGLVCVFVVVFLLIVCFNHFVILIKMNTAK